MLLTPSVRRWECGGCPATHVTRVAAPHAPMHQCPATGGLLVPYQPEGSRAKVTPQEREDYVNGEAVQLNDAGRPLMAAQIKHHDGRVDAVIYAPAATMRGGAL